MKSGIWELFHQLGETSKVGNFITPKGLWPLAYTKSSYFRECYLSCSNPNHAFHYPVNYFEEKALHGWVKE